MYFNRKNAEQKNWRMIKKGKHFLFGCSLVFAVGAALVAPSVKADATVETKPETGSTTETKPEAGPTTETTKATAGEENVTYAAPAAEAQTSTEANAKPAPAPATPAKAEEKAAPVAAATKESDSVAAPSLTTVADASALTAEEISNVTEAIKGVNPTATDVKVSKDGSAVVTFKDGSSATLAASQTVKVKAKDTSASENPASSRRARSLQEENTVSTRSFDSDLQNAAQKTAIYSPGVKGATQTYEGIAWLYRNGNINDPDQKDAKRLGGVNVYLQYVTGKGFVSPVYKTTSQADGTFVFDLSKPVKNRLGATGEFKLAGDSNFAIRTWVENPDPEKYNVIKSGDQRTGFHGRLSRTNESWDFTAGINRIVGGQVVLQEKLNAEDYLLKPEAERQKGNLKDGQFSRKGNYGTIQGSVWYDLRDPSGSDARMYKKDSYDINATNVKVAASYLNDEVTRLLDQWKKDNKNYKLDDFKAAQAKIIKEYEAKHGKGSHIAETVVVPVDKDGNYRIPFRGLYGISATQANSGAKISYTVSDKEFGTLVKDEDLDNENLMKWNGTVGQKHRHINTDYVYTTVLVNDYAIWSNNYQSNMFEGTSDGTLPVGSSSLASANISNTNFALVTPQPMHDVLVYDNTEKFAKPGNTAESKTGGLMPNREYQIRWFKDGKAIGEATTVMSAADGTAKSVPLTVPADLDKDAIYTSAVFLQGEKTDELNSALALDSFTAVPDDETDKYTPEYADTLVTPGKPATVTPTFKGKDNAETKAPEGATYSIPSDFKAPEGYTVTIDPNTGAITTEAKPGTTIEEVDVPVTVTYKDKSTDSVTAKFKLDTDGDGIPDVTDDDDDNDGVKDTDETTDGTNTKDPNSIASKITPIDDQTGVVGKEITPVTVTVEKVPTDGSVKVEGLPDGVSYDPATKQITGTPTTEGVSKVTVTVLGKDGNPVKGADGKPVTETFTFTVTKAPTQAEENTPTPKEQTVNVGETPDPKKSIGNVGDLPEGTKFEFKTPVDTTTPGDKDATVVVTYPDGSKDEVPVKVTVADNSAQASDSTPAKKAEAKELPNTGTEAHADLAALGLLGALSGFGLLSRKKKED
ncbi:Rib/alpha-like domain-containing protein [Streptococcus anginosus]|uniref:Rib/alpha-like domain-containing protein n=2 Tax=Streptococcus anginosus TaxID=1328 RepID=UPI001246357B|nr:Rib/alpha-like domain-containing protein [Streptococcus anginosus]KAA9254937.1 LPXTG cell wall anchor domain-containing protein [Streptococcus anginosus]